MRLTSNIAIINNIQIIFSVCSFLFTLIPHVHSQEVNYVLDLDGDDDCVELPSNILNDMNEFIDPSIEVYKSYMEKRQPEIERLLKLKQFDSAGIEGQIAKRLSNIIASHSDDKKRKSYKVKDWIYEMAAIAKYRRDCSCC